MYRYIRGIVTEKGGDYIVVESGGLGYLLLTSMSSLQSLKIGDEAKLYCVLIVREDEISLCGFAQDEERRFFEYLTGVSGIGKKNAISMLGFADYMDIVAMILQADEKKLQGLPSVGKKTAQRLILELRDKLKKQYGEPTWQSVHVGATSTDGGEHEAVIGLRGLGFHPSEIQAMLSGLDLENMSVEEIISKALLRK